MKFGGNVNGTETSDHEDEGRPEDIHDMRTERYNDDEDRESMICNKRGQQKYMGKARERGWGMDAMMR